MKSVLLTILSPIYIKTTLCRGLLTHNKKLYTLNLDQRLGYHLNNNPNIENVSCPILSIKTFLILSVLPIVPEINLNKIDGLKLFVDIFGHIFTEVVITRLVNMVASMLFLMKLVIEFSKNRNRMVVSKESPF